MILKFPEGRNKEKDCQDQAADMESEYLEDLEDVDDGQEQRRGIWDRVFAMLRMNRDDGVDEDPASEMTESDRNGKRETKQAGYAVVRPTSMEDCMAIAEKLKAGNAVMINLEQVDTALGQRVIDFCAGAAFMSGLNIRRVGTWHFIISEGN